MLAVRMTMSDQFLVGTGGGGTVGGITARLTRMDNVAHQYRYRVERQSLKGQDDQKSGRYDEPYLNVAKDDSNHLRVGRTYLVSQRHENFVLWVCACVMYFPTETRMAE
mmetsp:Transcript_7355/g.12193  ORF Transcript_7355/g.12193 Transcript_7355/m.12193 type:complete len:109 (-) Transcript_7355:143-469(-)